MEIPYSKEDPDGETFMDTNDKIYMSHKKKIEELNEKLGTNSPFSNYKINSSNSGGYLLEKVISKTFCSNCEVGRANKNCKYGLCKKCCDEKGEACAAHKSKKAATNKTN